MKKSWRSQLCQLCWRTLRVQGPRALFHHKLSQNVHLTSVQNTATRAVKIILESKRRPNSIREIQQTFARLQLSANSAIADWCSENHVHLVDGITYGELLQHVWSIIWDHNNKEELTKILYDELQASIGLCSTSRFTRTVNALTGFVDGLQCRYLTKKSCRIEWPRSWQTLTLILTNFTEKPSKFSTSTT